MLRRGRRCRKTWKYLIKCVCCPLREIGNCEPIDEVVVGVFSRGKAERREKYAIDQCTIHDWVEYERLWRERLEREMIRI